MKKVSLVKVDGDVVVAVRRAMELADWKSYIPAESEVGLKVNLGWDLFIPGSITSPLVTEGVILTIRDWVKKIYLVESNQVLEDIEKAYRKSGMNRLAEKYGVEWVNLSRQKTRKIVNNDNHIFQEVEIAEILLRLPMITIPVMKTHDKTVITGAIKNQWGCISEMRHNYHLVLDEALAELNALVTPRFAVMDATVCLEGNGPKSGNPKIADLVLAAGDFVALDTVQARLMGFEPQTIPHIQNCARRGLGVADLREIEIVGEDIERHIMKFKSAKHNLVSLFELALRKSPGLRYLFFETPLFKVCLLLAKMYYIIWTLLKGNGYMRQISLHPVYGKQWERKD